MARFDLKLSALALGAGLLFSAPVHANTTFPPFFGNWEGEGTIAWKSDGSKERMKCTAGYAQGKDADQLALKFECKSDNYNIVLDGTMDSSGDGNLSGRWSERSRNIGGTAIGQAKNELIRLRIESSAFGANMFMGVKNDRLRINIKSSGAGEEADSDISLKRVKTP